MTDPDTTILVPKAFRLAGVYCGIKSNPDNQDLTLVVCDRPATAAGVYTQNRVCAAPVDLDRERTPNDQTLAVVVNSGNANACTGQRGRNDAARMCELVCETCGLPPESVLVMSTGVIGAFLPMEKIAGGIAAAASELGGDQPAVIRAARGMMTTDTVHKVSARTVDLDGASIRILGMAKGAAMIGPNMATMLGLVLTDAPLTPETAQEMLRDVVDATFNCIHVDGHTSTNDTVLLVASGAAGGGPLDGPQREKFRDELSALCTDLARSIPADGEGASHLISIQVTGCSDDLGARRIARTVADSPLVKTAITGADPNWGRIVSAAGYAGVEFDPEVMALKLNGFSLYADGAPVSFDAGAVSKSIQDNRETSIELSVGAGNGQARFWTTDLTAEYVRLNADYHT